MANEVIASCFTIAPLGRPFQLGMLYDCRSDKIIPGYTLWDSNTLEEKSVQNLNTADFEITASDTIEAKSSALDVNVGLKLSFLGGLLDVSGAAKYLINRKSSNRHERVTLKYNCTTRSESMTMHQLGKGKLQHPEIFDHDMATHVVTGITYGGNIFFVFDRERSSNTSESLIGGQLSAMIEQIPDMAVDAKGHVYLSDEDKKRAHNLSCKYFGDFRPDKNPSTFEEAVRLYKSIPKLVGEDGKNSVPIKAHLYPLSLLDSKSRILVRDISTHLIKETEKTLENLHQCDVRCNDLINSEVLQNFWAIIKEIGNFKSLVESYKLVFRKELSQLLPFVRGGKKEESELTDLLKRKHSSPFADAHLNAWIEEKERNVKILSQYVSSFSQIKFESEPGDFEAMILSPGFTHNLCFTILMPKGNRYLSLMSEYFNSEYNADEVDSRVPSDNISDKERCDGYSMMQKARHYRDFFEANKGNPSISFIVRGGESESQDIQAKVEYFINGKLHHQDFEIPGPPLNVEVVDEKTTQESCVIKWERPCHGVENITGYKIVCKDVTENSEIAIKSNNLCADDLCTTVTGLRAGCEYEVSVQSICEAGVSLPNKYMTIKTRKRRRDRLLQKLSWGYYV